MNSLDTRINYFVGKLTQVRSAEAKLKELIGNDNTTLFDARNAEKEYKYLDGQFSEELIHWLKEQGVGEQFHLVEAIQHFRNKKVIETL